MIRIITRYVGPDLHITTRHTHEEGGTCMRKFLVLRTTVLLLWIVPIFAFEQLRRVDEI